MLEIHKRIVLDENQKPFAVQIPIDEFERLEDIIENYGLSKLIDEVKDDERLSTEGARVDYQSLKKALLVQFCRETFEKCPFFVIPTKVGIQY